MPETTMRNLFAAGWGLLAGAAAFWVMHIPHISPEYPADETSAYLPAQWPPPEDDSISQEDLDGEGLYAANCAACHQAAGTGTPGAFPPLAGSEWVTADVETPIRVALLGLSGPITVKGESYNSAMPNLGLDDDKVAKIVSHVRTSWGHDGEEITAEKVAEVRASLDGRSEPWKAEELTALRAQ